MLSIINIIFLNNLKNVIKYWINVKKKLLLISRLTKHIFSLINFIFDMFFVFFLIFFENIIDIVLSIIRKMKEISKNKFVFEIKLKKY